MLVASHWDTHPPLSVDTTPFATRANLMAPKVGCQIVPVPAGFPPLPDGSTHCVHSWAPAGAAVNFEFHAHPDQPQADILGAGRWHRWPLLIPKTTLDAIGAHPYAQVKLFLSRTGVSNHFTVLGFGPAFHSNDNRICACIDQYNGVIGLGPAITPDVWHSVEVFEQRSLGVGYTIVKWDGTTIAEARSPLLGDDNPKLLRGAAFSCYTEKAAGTQIDLFVGNISITSGP